MRGLLTEHETKGSWWAFLQRKELEGGIYLDEVL